MWAEFVEDSVAIRLGMMASRTLFRISGEMDQSSSGDMVTEGILIERA
jgi:hypothetical protein